MGTWPTEGESPWGDELKGYIDDLVGDVADATVAVASDLVDEAALARNANNLTSGTVADARIASTIARDTEVTAAVAAEAALARNATNLTSGTVADARIPVTIAREADVEAMIAALPEIPGPSGPPGPPMPIDSVSVVTGGPGETVTLTPLGSTMWTVMLSGNINLTATDLHPGQFLYVNLVQDSTGSRTVTLPTTWGGYDAITFATTPNYHDTLTVWKDGLGGTYVKRIMTGPQPAGLKTPLDLSNQHDWFAADSISSALEDAEVLSWINGYASGADMTAPGGAGTGPTLRTEFGMKYLEFNGSDNYLESSFASISPPFTIAMVVRVNEITGLVPVLNGPNVGNTDVFVDGSPTRTWRANSSGATQTSTGTWETILAHIKNDGTGYIRRNGSQTTVNTGGAVLVGLRIARQAALSTNYGQIDLQSLIVLTKTPAGTDVADIENMLNPKRDQLLGL